MERPTIRLSLPWIEDYQVIRGLEIVSKFRNELEYLEYARDLDSVVIGDQLEKYFYRKDPGAARNTNQRRSSSPAEHDQVRLNVPGEKEYTMKGVCYSALSYAPLFFDKKAVVIGNDELALRSAGELATVAKHVTLVTDGDGQFKTDLGKKIMLCKKCHHTRQAYGCGDERRYLCTTVVVKDKSGSTVHRNCQQMVPSSKWRSTPNTQMLGRSGQA